MLWKLFFVTSAHRLTVVPVRIAGVDALNRPWPLLHDKAWRAAEGNSGAQLIGDVAAAKVPMGHVGLPAVFIIERLWKRTEKNKWKRLVCVHLVA